MDNPVIITKRNTDTSMNPISIHIIETREVAPNGSFIVLKQIPDELERVSITGYKEIFDVDKMKNNTFKVDYQQGIVYFHPKSTGKTVTIDYYGIGYELISCSRIFTKYDKYGNVIETLEDVLDNIYEIKPILDKLADNDKLIDQLNTDIKEAKELQPILHNDVIQGNQAKQQLEQSIANAQDDINTINATGNEIKYIKTNQWVWSTTSEMYEYTLNHTMNSKALTINCFYTDTDDFATVGGRILDKNNILFKNEEAVNLTCVLSARFFRATTTISDNIVSEVIEARMSEPDLKTKISKLNKRAEFYYDII